MVKVKVKDPAQVQTTNYLDNPDSSWLIYLL